MTTFLRKSPLWRLFVLCLLWSAVGCGPHPEKIGDACDPDGDPCPKGSLCLPGGDDHTCQPPPGIAEGGACDPADDKCAEGLSCAELEAGGNKCYAPVFIKGMVFDSQTNAGIAKAHVLALDDQDTAVTDVAVTDAAGNYTLEVPVPRQADGAPVMKVFFKLRASASGYQTFPGGLRTALPISSSDATSEADGWNLKSTITDIALIALPMSQQGLGSISGKVLADAESGGVLVVAEDGTSSGHSAISDRAGAYTIFNVPAGSYTVKGYAAGLQLVPAMATVASAALTGVDLALSPDTLGAISGDINIVNPGMGNATSVVLVVASTFSDTFVRGEVPRGLRAPLTGPPSITGAFTISDVPAGDYVVLAAFENDYLVRDPDPNIAGTQIVTFTMPSPGTDMPLPSAFKITGALPVIGPGVDSAEPVTAAPTLEWGDDSSEDFYTVVVYNAYGDLVWCLSDQMIQMTACDGPNVPAVSGSATVTVPYGGPLDPGMYYQFRATSWRMGGPISSTEDLRGVFYVEGAP